VDISECEVLVWFRMAQELLSRCNEEQEGIRSLARTIPVRREDTGGIGHPVLPCAQVLLGGARRLHGTHLVVPDGS